MKLIVPNALVNIINCFRVKSNLDYAKDTLTKEIVNDELIVSVIDNKPTSHDIIIIIMIIIDLFEKRDINLKRSLFTFEWY